MVLSTQRRNATAGQASAYLRLRKEKKRWREREREGVVWCRLCVRCVQRGQTTTRIFEKHLGCVHIYPDRALVYRTITFWHGASNNTHNTQTPQQWTHHTPLPPPPEVQPPPMHRGGVVLAAFLLCVVSNIVVEIAAPKIWSRVAIPSGVGSVDSEFCTRRGRDDVSSTFQFSDALSLPLSFHCVDCFSLCYYLSFISPMMDIFYMRLRYRLYQNLLEDKRKAG